MTAWTRTDEHGITVTFEYQPDQRGTVTLTTQEVEGLMRTGGWTECDCHEPGALTEHWGGVHPDGRMQCTTCDRVEKPFEGTAYDNPNTKEAE